MSFLMCSRSFAVPGGISFGIQTEKIRDIPVLSCFRLSFFSDLHFSSFPAFTFQFPVLYQIPFSLHFQENAIIYDTIHQENLL